MGVTPALFYLKWWQSQLKKNDRHTSKFLVQHIGNGGWNMECERFYYENIDQYYHSLRRLGIEYDSLNYAEALPFTQLLLKSLTL